MPTPKSKIACKTELTKFAVEVVTLRKAKGLSQTDLAKAVGISPKSQHNVEQANNWPSVPVLIGLRKTLRGETGSLLGT